MAKNSKGGWMREQDQLANPANLVRAEGCPQQQRFKPGPRSGQYRDREIGRLG
jgi:hypothetical protein